MHVLLTGSTGFIGSELLERLAAREDVVRVLVRPETLAQSENVAHLKQRDRVEIVAGSLMDADALGRATRGVEVVYHLAGLIPGPGVEPQDVIHTNIHGTEALLRASAASGARRLVFTSS